MFNVASQFWSSQFWLLQFWLSQFWLLQLQNDSHLQNFDCCNRGTILIFTVLFLEMTGQFCSSHNCVTFLIITIASQFFSSQSRHISDRHNLLTITVWESCQQSGFNKLKQAHARCRHIKAPSCHQNISNRAIFKKLELESWNLFCYWPDCGFGILSMSKWSHHVFWWDRTIITCSRKNLIIC